MRDYHKIKLTSAGKKFWGTKRNHMTIVVTDKPVELSGGYWDGGSRNEYWGATKGGSRIPLSYPTTPREFGGGEAGSVSPTPDMAVVQGGVFCGKVSFLTVYVTSLDGWLLAAHGVEVVRAAVGA